MSQMIVLEDIAIEYDVVAPNYAIEGNQVTFALNIENVTPNTTYAAQVGAYFLPDSGATTGEGIILLSMDPNIGQLINGKANFVGTFLMPAESGTIFYSVSCQPTSASPWVGGGNGNHRVTVQPPPEPVRISADTENMIGMMMNMMIVVMMMKSMSGMFAVK